MIRKTLFFSIILVAVIWLAGAHYVKSKLLESLESIESDNIKISYADANIGGSPFAWKIIFKEPKVTLVNQSSIHELSAEEAKFYFNYDLSAVRIKFPKKLEYKNSSAEKAYNYSLVSEKHINTNVTFTEPLCFINAYLLEKTHIKSFDVAIPSLKTIFDNRDIFHIANSRLQFTQNDIKEAGEYRLKIKGDYASDVSHLTIDKAYLSLDLNYTMRDANFSSLGAFDYDHKLDIHKGIFKFDNASIGVDGVLKLAKTSLPKGKMNISMTQYQDVVDLLVPEDFMISKSYIKKVIAKATMASLNKVASNDDALKFEVSFSDKGVSIGNLNLLELNLE